METGRTGKGREENGELGGKEKTKSENPKRRKIERLSEAITSKRFEKAQVSLPDTGNFYPVKQAQVFCSCSSISSLWQWRVPPRQSQQSCTGTWQSCFMATSRFSDRTAWPKSGELKDTGDERTNMEGCRWENVLDTAGCF